MVGLMNIDVAEAVSAVAAVYETPVLSDVTTYDDLTTSSKGGDVMFPTFSRFMFSDKKEARALLDTIRAFGYSSLAELSAKVSAAFGGQRQQVVLVQPGTASFEEILRTMMSSSPDELIVERESIPAEASLPGPVQRR